MPDIPLKFTRAEYADRLQKTRRAMEEKGVDLLIVSDPSNMNWLTGYDGWSFYVHQAVIVPPERETPGTSASAWAKPKPTACLTVSSSR